MVSILLPMFCVVDLDKQWFDAGCRRAYCMILNRLLIVPGVDHAMLIIGVNLSLLVLRPSRVYGAARESHNECERTRVL